MALVVLGGLDGPAPDQQSVNRTGLDQCGGLSAFAGIGQNAAFDIEATAVFADLIPYADGLGRIMLPELFDLLTLGFDFSQRSRIGTWHDDIPTPVDFAEETGIAFDHHTVGHALGLTQADELVLKFHSRSLGFRHASLSTLQKVKNRHSVSLLNMSRPSGISRKTPPARPKPIARSPDENSFFLDLRRPVKMPGQCRDVGNVPRLVKKVFNRAFAPVDGKISVQVQ